MPSGKRRFGRRSIGTKPKSYTAPARLYINKKGRDAHGIVTDEEYRSATRQIIAGFKAIRDPENGWLLHQTYRPQDIYKGDEIHRAPDLIPVPG